MKKLIAIIAFLSIGLSTFAMDWCLREKDVYVVSQTQPYMGNANGGENNKSMFKRMRENQIVVSRVFDTIYIQETEIYNEPLGRVFIAVNGVSIGELVEPNSYINVNNVAIYYNGQKNIKHVDLTDYSDKYGVYTVGFVGVEKPVNFVYIVSYRY